MTNWTELLEQLDKADLDYTPSSKDSDERATPDKLFKPLDEEFHFTLDVCASGENYKCDTYHDKHTNGLAQSWKNEVCFMNPPYSNIPAWLFKAEQESIFNHAVVVSILPCDTSTRWFHDFLWIETLHRVREGVRLRFPKGRFKFGANTNTPMFATIIAVFDFRYHDNLVR